MEATVKKEVEVTLKLNGEEAILLTQFLNELTTDSIQETLDGYTENTIEETKGLMNNLWYMLDNLEF